MKKINLLFTVILLSVASVFAQAPESFSYQAALRNSAGDIIASTEVEVVISILATTATGTEVFSEIHTVTTTEQGIINLNVGSVGDLSDVNWGADIYFIKTTVEGVEMGTSQLMSVPYALQAGNAYWDFSNSSELYFLDYNVGIGTDNPAAVFDVSRDNAGTNSQIWIEQEGAGDATIGYNAGTQSFAMGIDQSDGSKFKIAPSYDASINTIMTLTSTGEVGVGTEDPTATLEVVGTTKIGANGVAIGEIIEITGTTAVAGTSSSVAFPAGFDKTNTRIVSFEIGTTISGSGEYWRGQGASVAGVDGTVYTSLSTFIYMYFPDSDAYRDCPYRIIIMRVQ
jgi:hypothetical protein